MNSYSLYFQDAQQLIAQNVFLPLLEGIGNVIELAGGNVIISEPERKRRSIGALDFQQTDKGPTRLLDCSSSKNLASKSSCISNRCTVMCEDGNKVK